MKIMNVIRYRAKLTIAMSVGLVVGGFSPMVAMAADAQVLSTELVSLAPNGVAANAASHNVAMTPDGRYVVFSSSATNLVPGLILPPHTGALTEGYLYDRQTHITELISQSTSGSIGDQSSSVSGLSDDGRFVVFDSTATNIASGAFCSSCGRQVYLRDRTLGTTTVISTPVSGDSSTVAHPMSGNGDVIAYNWTDSAGISATYVYNRLTTATVTIGGSGSEGPRVSGDGRYVSYSSNGGVGSFGLYDVQNGSQRALPTDVASLDFINHDGSQVLYNADNGDGTLSTYVFTVASGQRQLLSSDSRESQTRGSISSDGRYVSYHTQVPVNGANTGFAWWVDLVTGQRLLIDDGANHEIATQVSNDGTQVAFVSRTLDPATTAGPQVFVAHIGTLSDTTPPTISYALSPTPNAAGWNKSDVTVTFACADADSGVASCSSPATVSTEGTNNQVTGMATDNAGNTATATAIVKLDKTAPTVGTPTMTSTFILFSANETISAMAGDALSGVAGGEYYIDTDPGVGNATAMTYAAGKVTASRTISGLSVGQHKLYVRTRDAAGNWSAPKSVTFFYV